MSGDLLYIAFFAYLGYYEVVFSNFGWYEPVSFKNFRVHELLSKGGKPSVCVYLFILISHWCRGSMSLDKRRHDLLTKKLP